jgi:hypothetical protein
MFVRFQHQGARLHVRVLQTRRISGKVRSEYIGALGSIDGAVVSVRERAVFWAKLPERLAALGNRVSEDQHAAICATLRARIPMLTLAEQQANTKQGVLLLDRDRRKAEEIIRTHHYTRSIPSGKSYYAAYGEAFVVWSLPANCNASTHFLPDIADARVFELTRLWAPDGHERNLLTAAIGEGVKVLRQAEPDVDLVMSYADPSAGHSGGVYRAASWIEVGRSEEVRAWRHKDGGPILPRRAFHSGSTHLNKPEVEALGYVQLKLPGKHRFVRPLSKRAKRLWQSFAGDERLVSIEKRWLDKLEALRGPGESLADVIAKLVGAKGVSRHRPAPRPQSAR